MSNSTKKIGLLGGTFDPVHNGHVSIAKQLLKLIPLDELHFIPCNIPPHRQTPTENTTHRLAMLRLATENNPHLFVNDIELQREEPSYTIDTLKLLREEYPNETLYWILGSDAFYHFNEWHEWQKILTLCELIIVNRGNTALIKPAWFNALSVPEQRKCRFQSINPINISATQLRQHLSAEQLPVNVLNYIKEHNLYDKKYSKTQPTDYQNSRQ